MLAYKMTEKSFKGVVGCEGVKRPTEREVGREMRDRDVERDRKMV